MQVRCMAAILLMVGKHLEQPDIVQTLLDTSRHPCKPQYNYASEVVTAGILWLYARVCVCVCVKPNVQLYTAIPMD